MHLGKKIILVNVLSFSTLETVSAAISGWLWSSEIHPVLQNKGPWACQDARLRSLRPGKKAGTMAGILSLISFMPISERFLSSSNSKDWNKCGDFPSPFQWCQEVWNLHTPLCLRCAVKYLHSISCVWKSCVFKYYKSHFPNRRKIIFLPLSVFKYFVDPWADPNSNIFIKLWKVYSTFS